MTIVSTDIKFKKSVVQTDTSANGGRVGSTEITSGTKHAIFPRVTKAQRTAGLSRYRKAFYCNENADDESAYGVLLYFMRPSNADDMFYLAEGTQTDTQVDFDRDTDEYARVWTGCGQLAVALSGGESSVQLAMEDDNFQFPNGGYLYLSNNVSTGQTIDSDVSIGNSVYYSSGSWSKVAATTNITYPYGWCVATDEVLTLTETTNEEFLLISDNHYSGEVLGTGNGSNASVELATLTNVTNGICRQPSKLPVITTVCGGVARTVNVDNEGACSGYCSAGELNMATGVWTTDITWTTAPDNGVDIVANYRENAYSYSGNTATIALDEQVANAYTTATTFGSGCVYSDEVKTSSASWTETSGSGTYDETTYPVILYNDGTVEENWTLTFSNGTSFAVTGAYYGSIGIGSVGTDYSPVNPDTGQPYFTISATGWGGTWSAGNTVTFATHPSALPLLINEIVPAGAAATANNLLPIGSYTE